MSETFSLIAKTFSGLEEVLAEELRELGAADVAPGRRMCSFRGDRRLLYRVNIECRTAVRVLKPIGRFPADGIDALYRRMGRTNWLKHLRPEGTLAIDPVTSGGIFKNSLYAAQVAKDAICDQIRRASGQRPSVDLEDPDLRINLHIDQKRVTLYLDASGDSLHKRGYRQVTGEAPLNEVLAAGILRLTGWDQRSALTDFMCGSGTLAIEAAMMARRIAPGLTRGRFGYERWLDFDPALHAEVLAASRDRQLKRLDFPIVASDVDPAMITIARENARRAGVERDITWQVLDFGDATPPTGAGTVVTNPPYDERIKVDEVIEFHRRLGDVLKHNWPGHTAWILAGNLPAAKFIGLRPGTKIKLFNGPIECRLLKFAMYSLEEGTRKAKHQGTKNTKEAKE